MARSYSAANTESQRWLPWTVGAGVVVAVTRTVLDPILGAAWEEAERLDVVAGREVAEESSLGPAA
jgi:hypothetical protein